jgi:hypothetical protein
MAVPKARHWRDARDGREWDLVWEPGVEEDEPAVRRMREGIRLVSGAVELKIPAVYGSDLNALSDRDLEGLLDQAREHGRGSPR